MWNNQTTIRKKNPVNINGTSLVYVECIWLISRNYKYLFFQLIEYTSMERNDLADLIIKGGWIIFIYNCKIKTAEILLNTNNCEIFTTSETIKIQPNETKKKYI